MNINFRTATDTKMVGEYLMFFKSNTRSKFTVAKNSTLFFHQFNQPRVQYCDTALILATVVSKRYTQELPVVNTQGSSTGFLGLPRCKNL